MTRKQSVVMVFAAATLAVSAATPAAAGQSGWDKNAAGNTSGWGAAKPAAEKAAPSGAPAKAAAVKPIVKAAAPAAKSSDKDAVKAVDAPEPVAVATVAAVAESEGKPAAAAPKAAKGDGPEGVVMPERPKQSPVAAAVKAPSAAKKPAVVKGWLDVQAAGVNVRYRDVETSAKKRTNNQMQDQVQVKARVKLDSEGKYAVNVGVATGNSITGGWNTTGVGTGDLFNGMYFKQLFFSAAPVKGLDLQYGSLSVVRGETTEVTTYDNDVYLMGERVSVKRPKEWFFDEVSLTQAYLGDNSLPSVFDRYKRLDEVNYHQALVAKKVGKSVSMSADYTRVSGIGTTRGAIAYKKALGLVDLIRLEEYKRDGVGGGTGYSAYGEKAFGKRGTFGTGFATIDPRTGALNGDRYNKGRRLFANGAFTITPEFGVQLFYTKAVANDYAIANAQRLDIIFTYNLLKSLQRSGRF